ncbi:MAG: hypothetical protein JSV96_01310 [Candidatus Aminicenantes bacterium]|nr:MAG: hypothetical protein JSV96_01310 [Candidatus Aminicenantes bacterium]
MNRIKIISSKREKEEHNSIIICGILAVSFLILLITPSFLLLSNEIITAEISSESALFRPSSENMVAMKSSKYSAALSLAKVGIERAVWDLNQGNFSSWEGNGRVRTMTISSFHGSDGQVIGDIEIRVEKPDGDNPVVESTGRVTYSDSLFGTQKAKIVLQRQIRVVLEKKGHHKYQPIESS